VVAAKGKTRCLRPKSPQQQQQQKDQEKDQKEDKPQNQQPMFPQAQIQNPKGLTPDEALAEPSKVYSPYPPGLEGLVKTHKPFKL